MNPTELTKILLESVLQKVHVGGAIVKEKR